MLLEHAKLAVRCSYPSIKKTKTPNMTDVNILHEYIFIFPNFTKVIGFKV